VLKQITFASFDWRQTHLQVFAWRWGVFASSVVVDQSSGCLARPEALRIFLEKVHIGLILAWPRVKIGFRLSTHFEREAWCFRLHLIDVVIVKVRAWSWDFLHLFCLE
jgi:hypothetical protein